MSIAVISDVHANLEALKAVLHHAESQGVDEVVCLGDVVGYNADPEACVAWLRNLPRLVCLMGNHDAMAAGVDNLEGINPLARQAMEWTRERLDDEALSWLRDLPLEHRQDSAVFVHASLVAPETWPYIRSVGGAQACFDVLKDKVCFIGHTHLQGCWQRIHGDVRAPRENVLHLESADAWLINVGSVGQPRDGDARAGYAVYDPDRGIVTLHRLAYDVEAARAKIMAAGLPPYLAERLL